MRRSLLVLVVIGLVGGASAQPPDPALPTRVPANTAELSEVRRRSSEAESEGARALAEIEALEARIAERKGTLRTRLRALYRITRGGTMPLAGGLESMLAHTARVDRLERIVRADAAAVRYLERQREALVGAATAAQRAHADAEVKRAALEAQAAIEGAYAMGPGIYLPNLPVTPLPAQGTAPLSPYGAVGVASAPSTGVAPAGPSGAASGFAALEGSLGWPLRGPSTARDAVRDSRPGLELLAAAGTPVISAASGQVVFAGTQGAYGQLVVLAHQDGYFTVYGGLGRLEVRAGQPLGRGASIGTVAGGVEPSLFFEVRQGQQSLDPHRWLGR